jgi:YHS domain-containing protein
MLVRLVLFVLLAVFAARAFWRFVDGVAEGLRGAPRARTPRRGVHMVRDPVCGTFVLPNPALSTTENGRPVYFCSARCLAQYRRARADAPQRQPASGRSR